MWRTRLLLLNQKRPRLFDSPNKQKCAPRYRFSGSFVRVVAARSCVLQPDRRICGLTPEPATAATAADAGSPTATLTLPERCVAAAPSWLQPHLKLLRLHKPAGTWLLYIPCTWSIGFAADPGCLPSLYYLSLFGAGALVMRGAGCIINDMWDRDYDGKVERTRTRPLANSTLTMPAAFGNLSLQLSIGLAILLQLNWYSIAMGFLSMTIVVTYPLFKRVTYWPQLVLGFAFNWGALMGWAAVKGSCDWTVCLPLYTAGIMWTLYYDTIYAHQDKADDILIGVKSLALKLGSQSKVWFCGFSSAMMSSLAVAGIMADQTLPYYCALSAASLYVANQIRTLDLDDTQACWEAFCAQKYLGLWIFGGIVLGTLAKSEKSDAEELPEEVT